MPRSGPAPELVRHPGDLAIDAGAELTDGEGVTGVQLELIQLGLLPVTLGGELLVAEERVVGDAVRIHPQGFAALCPTQVSRLRAHRETIGSFRTGLERPRPPTCPGSLQPGPPGQVYTRMGGIVRRTGIGDERG